MLKEERVLKHMQGIGAREDSAAGEKATLSEMWVEAAESWKATIFFQPTGNQISHDEWAKAVVTLKKNKKQQPIIHPTVVFEAIMTAIPDGLSHHSKLLLYISLCVSPMCMLSL